MTTRFSFLALPLLLLAACSTEAASEPEATVSEELRFCHDSAPVLADRTAGKPALANVEIAASLPYPAGNIAADADGRVFISMFPDTNYGSVKVGRLGANGALEAFPSAAAQDRFQSVLGIRADRQGRLWVLDHGKMGLHRPKLYSFDTKTGAERFTFTFPVEVAPLGSMMNDVVIAPDGKTAYVSDPSLVFGKPAIVVVDLVASKARRVLERHPSVMSAPYDVVVNGKKARVGSILCAEAGVDGLALDATGDFLYYAPMNAGAVYRVATSALRDPRASIVVEKWADATMTDGMIADADGNVYLSDMEHSAVVRVTPDRGIEVVAKDDRLRWPDGFAWAPDGGLYVTASALHQTMAKLVRTKAEIERGAPYHVLRIPR